MLVLDNFEDVLEHVADGAWHIADVGTGGQFYSRVQTELTAAEGGRVVVTSRYLPAGTNDHLATVDILSGLADFKDYEFFKLLKRDEVVAQRIGAGELPIALLDALYRFAGGTPRFLERLRTLLRTFSAKQLEDALKAGRHQLVKERDQLSPGPLRAAVVGAWWPRTLADLLSRLALSEHLLPEDALAIVTGLDGEPVVSRHQTRDRVWLVASPGADRSSRVVPATGRLAKLAGGTIDGGRAEGGSWRSGCILANGV